MLKRYNDPEPLVQSAELAPSESEELDRKSEWNGSDEAWEELVRDIVAMANTGGGLIAFGCETSGKPSGKDVSNVRAVDHKVIIDKVRSATNEVIAGIKVVNFTSGGQTLPAWFVPWSKRVIVFTRDATQFSWPSGAPKIPLRFYQGQVFWRHGSSTERANATDLEALIEERAKQMASEFFSNVPVAAVTGTRTSTSDIPVGSSQGPTLGTRTSGWTLP